MAFYMGLSNRYGGRYQSCNMDENNWYESVHQSYSTQHSNHVRNNIDSSMTVPVSSAFSSHTVCDSEPVFPHSSANNQRSVHSITQDSLYFPERIDTPVPINTSAEVHSPVYTPSSTPIPITVHTPRPIYSLHQGNVTEPVNIPDQLQTNTLDKIQGPISIYDEGSLSSNNQGPNIVSVNKPVAIESTDSIPNTNTVFSSIKDQLTARYDSSFNDNGYETEDSVVSKTKDYTSYTPLNYSIDRPLDCSIAKKKEEQAKARKQRFLDETTSEREERLERIRKQALLRRLNETPEQRTHRLLVARDRMRRLRDNETEDERAKRLIKGKELQYQRRIRERITETKEERDTRLREACDRSRQRRADENTEQRAERLRVTRDRLRLKRRNESPETRARRLKTTRERKKIKYHQMSHEDREMMRIREREKTLMKISESDPEYKRKTRGKELKYDTFEEDLEDALLQLHDGQIPYLNIPETVSDHYSESDKEPIIPVVKKEMEVPQPDYSKEYSDTQPDIKPVVGHTEQVLTGAADHGDNQSNTYYSEDEDSHSYTSGDTGHGDPQLPIGPQLCLREDL